MKKLLFLAAVVLFTTQAFSGTTITVRTDGSGNYSTIAAAITASADGDIIDVLGTFTESGLTVTKGITIQGHGFANTIVQGNSTTPTSGNYSGLTRNSVFYINNSGGKSNINVTLKNMTIKNGVSATSTARAGGLTISKITGLVTLSGLKIVDNYGYSSSNGSAPGGLICAGSNLNIDHCWITGNTASDTNSHGGGMQLQTDVGSGYNGVVNIRNTSISGNHCTGTNSYGGGIAIITASGTATGKNIEVLVENSTIYGNDSKQIGNGIYVKNVILTAAGTGFGTTNCAAKLTVNHCTIANNSSSATSTQSYGITFDSGGTGLTVFSMNNSIVMGNYCTADVGINTAATTTKNQISAATSFDNITGCITNSITKGGAFTGLTGYNVQNGGTSPYNYTGLAFDSGLSSDSIPVLKIGAGSSAKDKISTNYITALTTDQLGNSRVGNTDIGAYEYGTAQSITGFASISTKTYGDAAFDVSATGGASGNPVTFSSSNTSVAAVSGSTITIVGTGTCTINANQAGNSTYYASPQVGQTLTVNKKALSIGAASIASKVYNGNTTSGTVTPGTLSGLIGTETVTVNTAVGTYPDANVGTGKSATIVYTLANGTNGGLATNYSLANGSANGDISAKALSIGAASIASNVYNGSATSGTVTPGILSGFVSGETVTVNTAVGTYADANVGTGKSATIAYTLADGTGLASNYSLANGSANGDISAKALSIGAASIASKVYNGSATSGTVTPGILSGFVSGETVTVNTAVGTYADANVGIGKSATIAYTLADGTGLASNYSLANGSANGDITAATLTLNNAATTFNATNYTLTDLANSDLVVSAGEFVADRATNSVQSVTVAPGAKLSLGSNTFSAANGITLQSDPSGTATLTGDNAVSNAKVQQYVTAGRNWYMSSPITTAAYSLLNRGNSVVEWNETTKVWDNVTNGNLVSGKGYIQIATAAQGTTGTIDFNGTTNSGDITVSLTRTESGSSRGFNLVGNPYPSYLDWKKVAASNTNVLPTIWLRSKKTSGAGGGYTFATVNVAAYLLKPLENQPVISAGFANTNITTYIPPMQAYWVRLNTDYLTTDFKVTNEMRSHGDDAGNTFKAPVQKTSAQALLRLEVSNGTTSDEAVVYFNESASNGFDIFDSPKMANGSTSVPEIYTLAGSEQLVINGLNSIPYDTELPIGFSTGTAGSFSLKASQLANFDAGTQLILKDYADVNNPVSTDLSDGSNYPFTSSVTSNNSSRFTLTFRAPSVTTGLNSSNNNNIWISTNANGQIIINGNSNAETIVAVYNAVGQMVSKRSLKSNSVTLENPHTPGVYLVAVSNSGKTISKKVIID